MLYRDILPLMHCFITVVCLFVFFNKEFIYLHIYLLANVNATSPSLYAVVNPSVCLSSVTFVSPTQAIEIFGNVSVAFGSHPLTKAKFYGDRPREPLRRGGKGGGRGVNARRVALSIYFVANWKPTCFPYLVVTDVHLGYIVYTVLL